MQLELGIDHLKYAHPNGIHKHMNRTSRKPQDMFVRFKKTAILLAVCAIFAVSATAQDKQEKTSTAGANVAGSAVTAPETPAEKGVPAKASTVDTNASAAVTNS